MQPVFSVGDEFKLSDAALDNYGAKWSDTVFRIRSIHDHYVSSREMANDPSGHPGFDKNGGSPLYEADGFPGALYAWEMEAV